MVSVTKAMLPLIRKSQAGRIVNMSSGLGSLKQQSDPNYEFYDVSKFLGYNVSKTAVNQFTVHLAYELNETKIKVNSADPGYTSTGLNNFRGARSVQQAATVVVRLATLSEDGPKGGFFDENGVVPG
jgi:NAD(P)-dependent dehydrogenase (short-subunit alcohol dehydrogenase family)